MSQSTANGAPVLGGIITMPRGGAWRADLDLDLDDAKKVTGDVSVIVDDMTWNGTSVEAGTFVGRTRLRVVGGKGGLGKPTKPRFYQAIPARTALADLLREGGESLASSSAVATTLDFWTRPAATVSEGIGQLVDELGATWRMLDDGTIWVGTESWPTAKVDGVIITASVPSEGRIDFASATPSLRPGTTFNGQHVDEVEIHLSAGDVHTKAWFGERGDQLHFHLAHIVRQETKHLDFFAIRGGHVVSQNDDGTLELKLDDPTMPGMSKVPIAYGIPGVSATVLAGARIHLEFENGSPAKPRAVVVDAAKLKTITIKASQKVIIDCADVESQKGGRPLARLGDMVRVISTAPGTPAIGQIVTANKTHRG